MTIRWLICYLMLCAPTLVQPQSPNAQPSETQLGSSEAKPWDKVKSEVQKLGTGEKVRVKITLQDGREVKGYISQVGSESFRVTDKKTGKVTTIAYQYVKQVKKELSTGAKIGVTMLGWGVAAAKADRCASGTSAADCH